MQAQKIYSHKYFGGNIKALETVEDGEGVFCKAWDFKKNKVVYVDTFEYVEMDIDVAASYDTVNIEVHSPVERKAVKSLRVF